MGEHRQAKGEKNFNMPDLEAAQKFADLLHGQLDPANDGLVAYMVKHHTTNRIQTHYAPPRSLPFALRQQRDETHYWQSVCTFRETGSRGKETALVVPAVWADIDPPKDLDDKELEAWQDETYVRLSTFSLLPSIVVFSGRGWHGYWLLVQPLRLEGEDRIHNAALIEALNRKLANCLDGDAVADLARVMRIPGTVNPKNGAVCRIVSSNGPIYQLESLADGLGINEIHLEPAPPLETKIQRDPPNRGIKRLPGRPKLGVTLRDLRTLPSWARNLVIGGAWRSRGRYLKPGGEGIDRSRADMAAVGEMIRSGWSDKRIFAVFKHPRWLIGDRFRDLWENEGSSRAVDYLERTIKKAKGRNSEG